jgi:hypothetical protein
MITDAKKEASKSILSQDTRPRTVKELEDYTQNRKREVLGAKEDPHVKRTNSLVKATMERNKALL